VPPGTTSFYFRTRKALLLAIAERVSALDLADLSKMTELAHDDSAGYSGTLGLARLVILSGTEPYLTRSRARNELALMSTRDQDVQEVILASGARFTGLVRDVVSQWFAETNVSSEIVDQRATAVLLLIGGAMTSFVHGYPLVNDARHLNLMFQQVLAAGINLPETASSTGSPM
jgi:AcrR family transcriptional regulator